MEAEYLLAKCNALYEKVNSPHSGPSTFSPRTIHYKRDETHQPSLESRTYTRGHAHVPLFLAAHGVLQPLHASKMALGEDCDCSDTLPENADEGRGVTPLPWGQLHIVLLIQFAEPITGMIIFPFINQFVRETGVTGGDETRTGYFAGIIVRTFFATTSIFHLTRHFRNLCSSLQRQRLSYFGGWRPIVLDDAQF